MTRIAPILRHFGGTVPATAGGVDIDMTVEKANAKTVGFTTGDTVQVKGNIESDINLTAATVTVTINNLSDDVQITSLFSGSVNFVADTAKTLETINGSILTWTATSGNRYGKVAVTHADIQNADYALWFQVHGITLGNDATPESALRSLIVSDGVVSTRVFPGFAPRKVGGTTVAFPYIVYRNISGGHEHHMEGASGAGDVRIQVDCESDSYAEAKATAKRVRDALDGYQRATINIGTGSIDIESIWAESPTDALEVPVAAGEKGYFRVSCDYWVRFAESVPTF